MKYICNALWSWFLILGFSLGINNTSNAESENVKPSSDGYKTWGYPDGYSCVAGAFKLLSNARKYSKEFKKNNSIEIAILHNSGNGLFYLVVSESGVYKFSLEDARVLRDALRKKIFSDCWIVDIYDDAFVLVPDSMNVDAFKNIEIDLPTADTLQLQTKHNRALENYANHNKLITTDSYFQLMNEMNPVDSEGPLKSISLPRLPKTLCRQVRGEARRNKKPDKIVSKTFSDQIVVYAGLVRKFRDSQKEIATDTIDINECYRFHKELSEKLYSAKKDVNKINRKLASHLDANLSELNQKLDYILSMKTLDHGEKIWLDYLHEEISKYVVITKIKDRRIVSNLRLSKTEYWASTHAEAIVPTKAESTRFTFLNASPSQINFIVKRGNKDEIEKYIISYARAVDVENPSTNKNLNIWHKINALASTTTHSFYPGSFYFRVTPDGEKDHLLEEPVNLSKQCTPITEERFFYWFSERMYELILRLPKE